MTPMFTQQNENPNPSSACRAVCVMCGGGVVSMRGMRRCLRCGFMICVGCEGGEDFTPKPENNDADA